MHRQPYHTRIAFVKIWCHLSNMSTCHSSSVKVSAIPQGTYMEPPNFWSSNHEQGRRRHGTHLPLHLQCETLRHRNRDGQTKKRRSGGQVGDRTVNLSYREENWLQRQRRSKAAVGTPKVIINPTLHSRWHSPSLDWHKYRICVVNSA